MATYPIKMLKDEEGKAFVPLISIDSVQNAEGKNINELLETKLETKNIKAGSQISVKTEGNNVIISNSSEGMQLIDNLDTGASGVGALDARQGKVLKESIPEIVNNLTTIDSKKALSAHQGYVLAGRVAPTGGATGQVLKKASDSDYSFEWGDAADPNAIVGDGSIMKIVELSYEEYLALEAANQLQDDTEYHINDWNENERTYLTPADIKSLVAPDIISGAQEEIARDKMDMGTITADQILCKNLLNVYGPTEINQDPGYSVNWSGDIYCPSIDGNGGYILFTEKHRLDGTFTLSYDRKTGSTTRPFIRCLDAQGEPLTDNTGLPSNMIYNQIYKGFWIDYPDPHVSLTFNLNAETVYSFQVGFVGLGYTVTNVMLELSPSETSFIPQTAFGVWSGKTPTGSWIKYGDGTLIQWFLVDLGQCEFALHSGGLYTDQTRGGYYVWKYPIAFQNLDYIVNATCESSAYMCSSVGSKFTDKLNIYYHTNYPCTTQVVLNLVAIGRWK